MNCSSQWRRTKKDSERRVLPKGFFTVQLPVDSLGAISAGSGIVFISLVTGGQFSYLKWLLGVFAVLTTIGIIPFFISDKSRKIAGLKGVLVNVVFTLAIDLAFVLALVVYSKKSSRVGNNLELVLALSVATMVVAYICRQILIHAHGDEAETATSEGQVQHLQ